MHLVDCASNPCQNAAPCSNLNPNGYKCECPTGFTGTNCETKMCSNDDCKQQSGGGICNLNRKYDEPISGDNPNCLCRNGFTGHKCHIDINECTLSGGHQTCGSFPCVDRLGGFYCNYCFNVTCDGNTTCKVNEAGKTYRCVLPGEVYPPTVTSLPLASTQVTQRTIHATSQQSSSSTSQQSSSSTSRQPTSSDIVGTVPFVADTQGEAGKVSSGDDGVSTGMIAGIAAGGVVVVLVIIFIIVIVLRRSRRPTESYTVNKNSSAVDKGQYPETME